MKNIVFLIAFSLGILISCEKESSFFDDVHNETSPKSEVTVSPGNQIDQVHPSILQSSWWNDMSINAQEMIALELVGHDHQITNEDLQKTRALNLRHWNRTVRAGSTSPGYPLPNIEGNVVLTSQSEVDDFGSMGYNHILGYLSIDDFTSTEKICDLSPLSDLMSVGSYCFISTITCAKNLNGLQNLETVGLIGPFGAFSVVGENLKDIAALDNLQIITGSLNIISNPNLIDINTFYNIEIIGPGHTPADVYSNWVLSVRNNAKLKKMTGLSNLRQIAGRALITDNNRLKNINDLANLEAIGYFPDPIFPNKNLEIYNNRNLRNLNGLYSLEFIGESLLVNENVSLRNVNGLSGLLSLGENLEVLDNTRLNRFCGLYTVLSSGVPGTVSILGNDSDPTVAEILTDGPCR